MNPLSVEFCTAQAEHHLSKAELCDLANVRAICLTAADSWMREAESARRIMERRQRSASFDIG